MKGVINKCIVAFKEGSVKALVYTYAVCICATVIFHFTVGIANFGFSKVGIYGEKQLTVDSFETVGADYVDDMTIINSTNDTQLIYTGNIRNLTVKCEFSRHPGEFVCFYNGRGNYSFGTHKMRYAKVYGDYYVFEFPYGTKQIRLDTGVVADITVKFEEITINSFDIQDYFVFSQSELFTLLIIPGAIYFAIDTAFKLCLTINKKKINYLKK